MLLTELSMLKFNKKEKVKDFHQRVTTILNKFPMDVAPDDSITIDYYAMALPQDISIFVKHEEKLTLVENFVATLKVKKDLISIGTLEHKSWEDPKSSDKRNQAS